jgi:ferrous-iron efflux pump FieF
MKDRLGLATTGLVSSGLAVSLTVVCALTANSTALWADVIAGGIDLLCMLTAWLTIRRTSRRADESGFGHSRLESFASLGIGQLMALSFLLIMGAAVWKALHPEAIEGFGISLAIGLNVVYGVVNAILLRRSRQLELTHRSPTLSAARRLFLVKTLSNVVLVVTLGAALAFRGQAWAHYIDPALSVVIGMVMVLDATKTLRSSALNLVDRSLEERDQLLILRALAEHFQDFEMLHGVRTRHSGSQEYVELFLEFSPKKTMGEVQDTIDHLQATVRGLLGTGADVIIMPTRQAPPEAV